MKEQGFILSARRQNIHTPHKQNQSQKDRTGLIPVVLVHREDQRCADPACAHESENRRLTDIDVKAV